MSRGDFRWLQWLRKTRALQACEEGLAAKIREVLVRRRLGPGDWKTGRAAGCPSGGRAFPEDWRSLQKPRVVGVS